MTDKTPTKPVAARLYPYSFQVEKGKEYLWCTCGLSKTQPLCDTVSHKGTGMAPLKFEAQETGTKHLCACKQTKTPPFCDKTHFRVALKNKTVLGTLAVVAVGAGYYYWKKCSKNKK